MPWPAEAEADAAATETVLVTSSNTSLASEACGVATLATPSLACCAKSLNCEDKPFAGAGTPIPRPSSPFRAAMKLCARSAITRTTKPAITVPAHVFTNSCCEVERTHRTEGCGCGFEGFRAVGSSEVRCGAVGVDVKASVSTLTVQPTDTDASWMYCVEAATEVGESPCFGGKKFENAIFDIDCGC